MDQGVFGCHTKNTFAIGSCRPVGNIYDFFKERNGSVWNSVHRLLLLMEHDHMDSDDTQSVTCIPAAHMHHVLSPVQ